MLSHVSRQSKQHEVGWWQNQKGNVRQSAIDKPSLGEI